MQVMVVVQDLVVVQYSVIGIGTGKKTMDDIATAISIVNLEVLTIYAVGEFIMQYSIFMQ